MTKSTPETGRGLLDQLDYKSPLSRFEPMTVVRMLWFAGKPFFDRHRREQAKFATPHTLEPKWHQGRPANYRERGSLS